MLRMTFESGIGRKISVKKAGEDSSYAVLIEISATFMKIEVKLALVEAVSFFSKGQTLIAELTHLNSLPIPTKKQRRSGRRESNLL